MILERPANPDELRNAAQVYANLYPDALPVSWGIKGVVISQLDHLFGGDTARKLVLSFLFSEPGERMGPLSSKMLTPPQWEFLLRIWLRPEKVEGSWTYLAPVAEEAKMLREKINLTPPDDEKRENRPVRGTAI